VNAPRIAVRAAVPIELTCSRACRDCAWVSAAIAVGSAAARQPIADLSISSASFALDSDATLLIVMCQLLS
jgi:hypothetical protein